MNEIDLTLVDWSRAQFALTAIYHWFFVPLTLGITFIIAIMETIYYKTGSEEWKKITKFWMKLFGINFAIGVATGIILEFEFGTNWSKYSWIVGDIFGAPLAIEGIMAFFLESTFIAVMFFGWERVSKKFHLLSSWLVAFGSNLSALWILVANGWMQSPVGMVFNPDTARSEMANFWDVLFSPMAIHKFLHAISSGYVVSALFVIGISSWFILKKRNVEFAKKSIAVAAVFGLLSGVFVAVTGDSSAYTIAQKQPMKLAAMEGLYEGKAGAELVAFGVLNVNKNVDNDDDSYIFKFGIPDLLSVLAYHDANAYVPGIKDLIYGNEEHNIESAQSKIGKGRIAISSLADYKKYKEENDAENTSIALERFKNHYDYIGYGYFTDVKELIPPIALTFYGFHVMVILGFFFIALFLFFLWLVWKDKLGEKNIFLHIAVWSIPLGYLASQLGWVVAEVGRQPWTIQNILPTMAATSHISSTAVQVTFFLFAALFTVLLIAELKIMFTQIKNGPEGGNHV